MVYKQDNLKKKRSSKQVPKIRNPLTIMQLIWMFGCNDIFFCKIFHEPLLSLDGNDWVFILCGMLPVFVHFRNIEMAQKRYQGKTRRIIADLYTTNLICMAALVMGDLFRWGGELNVAELFLRETTILVFWFLSLSLALIYNYLWWGSCALNIYMLTLLYNQLWSWYLQSRGEQNSSALHCMIGILLLSAGVSFVFIWYRIKNLFYKNTSLSKGKRR